MSKFFITLVTLVAMLTYPLAGFARTDFSNPPPQL